MPITFRAPRWSVTWPTRPMGVYTVLVYAEGPVEAVRVAADLEMPLAEGYSMAFDYEPEVWRLRRPYRYRSHHVAGPDYGGSEAVAPFAPQPVDLQAIAAQAVSIIKAGHANDELRESIHLGLRQILAGLKVDEMFSVVAMAAAETREINAYTGGEF